MITLLLKPFIFFVLLLDANSVGTKALVSSSICISENKKFYNAKSDSIIDFAKKYLGIRYVYGGSSPKGFDCSGFVYYVFKKNNIKLPRSSRYYAKLDNSIDIKNFSKGDIILFSGTNNNLNRVGHVGIIISNNNENLEFIHSSSAKRRGIVITNFNKSRAYKKRFIGIRRVISNE